MAHRNQTDRSPDCLITLMNFIENNTGLLGEINPGDAHFSAGGTTVMITSDRSSFNHESILLKHIEANADLRIKHISVKTSYRWDSPHPYLEVVEA